MAASMLSPVADLADQDSRRGGTHHAAQRARVALGVEAHLALVDERALVGVQKSIGSSMVTM